MAVLLAFKASKTINLGSFARLNSRKAGKRVALQDLKSKKQEKFTLLRLKNLKSKENSSLCFAKIVRQEWLCKSLSLKKSGQAR